MALISVIHQSRTTKYTNYYLFNNFHLPSRKSIFNGEAFLKSNEMKFKSCLHHFPVISFY